MKRLFCILLIFISLYGCSQQPFFGTRKFITYDLQDTITITGYDIAGVDSIQIGGVWYTSLGGSSYTGSEGIYLNGSNFELPGNGQSVLSKDIYLQYSNGYGINLTSTSQTFGNTSGANVTLENIVGSVVISGDNVEYVFFLPTGMYYSPLPTPTPTSPGWIPYLSYIEDSTGFEAIPAQSGHSGEFLTTNGSVLSWGTANQDSTWITATADTFKVANWGIYSSGTEILNFKYLSSSIFNFDYGTTSYFQSDNSDGFSIKSIAATNNPVYSFKQDLNTGIGRSVDDNLNVITGGTPRLKVYNDSTVIEKYTKIDTAIFQDDTKQWTATQYAVTTSQFDKTDATLSNITGLSFNVVSGHTYLFEANIYMSPSAGGGWKLAIDGTCSSSSIIYSTNNYRLTNTSLGTAVAYPNDGEKFSKINGTITVSSSGALNVQFAQFSVSGTSSVLVGSNFQIRKID